MALQIPNTNNVAAFMNAAQGVGTGIAGLGSTLSGYQQTRAEAAKDKAMAALTGAKTLEDYQGLNTAALTNDPWLNQGNINDITQLHTAREGAVRQEEQARTLQDFQDELTPDFLANLATGSSAEQQRDFLERALTAGMPLDTAQQLLTTGNTAADTLYGLSETQEEGLKSELDVMNTNLDGQLKIAKDTILEEVTGLNAEFVDPTDVVDSTRGAQEFGNWTVSNGLLDKEDSLEFATDVNALQQEHNVPIPTQLLEVVSSDEEFMGRDWIGDEQFSWDESDGKAKLENHPLIAKYLRFAKSPEKKQAAQDLIQQAENLVKSQKSSTETALRNRRIAENTGQTFGEEDAIPLTTDGSLFNEIYQQYRK